MKEQVFSMTVTNILSAVFRLVKMPLLMAIMISMCFGCGTTPWVRGSITEGIPGLGDKFAPDTAFYVEKTERRVQKAFEGAIKERGFTLSDVKEECDFIVRISVDSWEYNTIGFGGGVGARDDMELSIAFIDRRKHGIRARSRISLRSDFRIIKKYVEGL